MEQLQQQLQQLQQLLQQELQVLLVKDRVTTTLKDIATLELGTISAMMSVIFRIAIMMVEIVVNLTRTKGIALIVNVKRMENKACRYFRTCMNNHLGPM